MAAIERLLTMGLAHGTDFERLLKGVPGSTTPRGQRVTWEDVMASVGAVKDKEQRCALYLKCAPSMVGASELAAFCFRLLTTLQRYERRTTPHVPTPQPHSPGQWHTPAERALHRNAERAFARQARVVNTVLAEYMDPGICGPCRGAGKVAAHIEGKGVVTLTCAKCEGRGWLRWSDNRRARAIGGDRNAYATRVAPGYEHTLKACSDLYRAGAAEFKRQLFGEPEDDIESKLQARA